MSTKSDTKLKKIKWTAPGIKKRLSYKKFKTNSLGLKGFYKWCQDKKVLDGDLKAAVRALKAESKFKKDKSIHAAINSAWDDKSK